MVLQAFFVYFVYIESYGFKYSFESLDKPGVTYGPMTIMPGEPEFEIDTSGDEDHWIALFCGKSYMEARVYVVPESEVLKAQRDDSSVHFCNQNLATVLYPGFPSYQREMVDREGECGRMVLQLVCPNGFIQSYN